jgi:DNA-directed RNA polymerase specialized sigma24 family protein
LSLDLLYCQLRDDPPSANRALTRIYSELRDRCGAVRLVENLLRPAGRADEAEDLFHKFIMELPRTISAFRGEHPGAAWRWTRIALLNRARDLLRVASRTVSSAEDEEPADESAPSPEAAAVELAPDVGLDAAIEEAARTLRARKYPETFQRNVALIRDVLRGVPVGELAATHFGADTKPNRNMVAQNKKRIIADLRAAAERVASERRHSDVN